MRSHCNILKPVDLILKYTEKLGYPEHFLDDFSSNFRPSVKF